MPTSRPYPPDICDAEEMAYLVSLSSDEFRKLVRDGTLPAAIRLGGREVWSRTTVVQAIEALTEQAQQRQGAKPPANGQVPNVYSVETLAYYWRCSPGTIRNLVRRGDLGHFKFGKLIRISKEHVETYERENAVEIGKGA